MCMEKSALILRWKSMDTSPHPMIKVYYNTLQPLMENLIKIIIIEVDFKTIRIPKLMTSLLIIATVIKIYAGKCLQLAYSVHLVINSHKSS